MLLGDDDFLTGRVVESIVVEKSAEVGTDVPVTRVRAGEVTDHELAELLSPSLFAEERVIVVEAAADAGKAKCEKAKWPSDKAAFVSAEFKRLGARVSGDVVEQVVDSVGGELRELAAACSQLVTDTGGKVTREVVLTYYQGRAEVTGFEVADKAVTGDRAGALESLAWACHHGVPRVLLADALAEAVHAIARVRGVSGDQYSVARELGMPPGRVKKVQGQARAWDSSSIAQAMIVVAQLNGDVKGQAADADYALEHAVSTVAGLRPDVRSRGR